jgi:hypothetical protein
MRGILLSSLVGILREYYGLYYRLDGIVVMANTLIALVPKQRKSQPFEQL